VWQHIRWVSQLGLAPASVFLLYLTYCSYQVTCIPACLTSPCIFHLSNDLHKSHHPAQADAIDTCQDKAPAESLIQSCCLLCDLVSRTKLSLHISSSNPSCLAKLPENKVLILSLISVNVCPKVFNSYSPQDGRGQMTKACILIKCRRVKYKLE